MKKYDEIERIIRNYFNELEEEFGYGHKYYDDIPDDEIIKQMEVNFKYFKAGFLLANIDNK